MFNNLDITGSSYNLDIVLTTLIIFGLIVLICKCNNYKLMEFYTTNNREIRLKDLESEYDNENVFNTINRHFMSSRRGNHKNCYSGTVTKCVPEITPKGRHTKCNTPDLLTNCAYMQRKGYNRYVNEARRNYV